MIKATKSLKVYLWKHDKSFYERVRTFFVTLSHPWHNLRTFTSIFCKCNNRNFSFSEFLCLRNFKSFYREFYRESDHQDSRSIDAPIDMQLHTVACNVDCISASRVDVIFLSCANFRFLIKVFFSLIVLKFSNYILNC